MADNDNTMPGKPVARIRTISNPVVEVDARKTVRDWRDPSTSSQQAIRDSVPPPLGTTIPDFGLPMATLESTTLDWMRAVDGRAVFAEFIDREYRLLREIRGNCQLELNPRLTESERATFARKNLQKMRELTELRALAVMIGQKYTK